MVKITTMSGPQCHCPALHHDEVIHFPEADEKEDAKDYVEEQTCSEWYNGFLLAGGMKFPVPWIAW